MFFKIPLVKGIQSQTNNNFTPIPTNVNSKTYPSLFDEWCYLFKFTNRILSPFSYMMMMIMTITMTWMIIDLFFTKCFHKLKYFWRDIFIDQPKNHVYIGNAQMWSLGPISLNLLFMRKKHEVSYFYTWLLYPCFTSIIQSYYQYVSYIMQH